MMKNLNKFNDKYLKCVVTNYESTWKELLKDSGTLIIYNPKESNDLYDSENNYIYLGDYFLASGYGFSSPEKVKKAERIVDTYDSDIESIKHLIKNEEDNRTTSDDQINEKLSSYVEKVGGIIDATKMTFTNGGQITVNEYINRGVSANYRDIDISTIRYKVNGKDIENGSFFIGEKIDTLTVTMNGNVNDSGGIKNINIGMNVYTNIYDCINNINSLQSYKIVNNMTKAISIFTFIIRKEYESDEVYYIMNNERNIIESFDVNIGKTTIFKRYPSLQDKNILSTELAIPDHTISIITSQNPIKIQGSYFIKYTFSDEIDSFPVFRDINIYDTSSYVEIPKNQSKSDVQINVSSANTLKKILMFAIPVNYSLKSCKLVTRNNKVYDYSGFVSILYKNSNSYLTYDYDLYINRNMKMKFNIFYIEASNGLENGKIDIELTQNNFTNLPVYVEMNAEEYEDSISKESSKLFMSNTFDDSYWIGREPNEESYDLIDDSNNDINGSYITYKLSQIYG